MTAQASLNGKVCLVTGATSGIGRVTAQALAQCGATVVVVGRSRERAATAVREIREQTGNAHVDALIADLSVQREVRALASQFLAHYPRLDVLVNNAGGVFAQRQETPEGVELTWALNHLSYFLLTRLLLERMVASAPARIVNVASRAHARVRGLNFDDLESRRGYFGFGAYGQSKLANVLFTYELARRLAGRGVTVNALHPGLVHTGFGSNNRQALWRLLYVFINRSGLTPEQGADTVIYLASDPAVEGVIGKYFYQRQAIASSPASYDEAAARRLWEVSEQMTQLLKE